MASVNSHRGLLLCRSCLIFFVSVHSIKMSGVLRQQRHVALVGFRLRYRTNLGRFAVCRKGPSDLRLFLGTPIFSEVRPARI